MENDEQNLLKWLQKWYKLQCNGDWEHEYGVKIETVDNPGWYIVVNLNNTIYEGHHFFPVKYELDEMDWYFCLVRNNSFEASCGPCNLAKVLQIFREWVENC